MPEQMRTMLPPGQWLPVDHRALRAHRDTFLCDDAGGSEVARSVLVAGGQPDSFTVAERLDTNDRLPWLDEHEARGTWWLTQVVHRRTTALPQVPDDSLITDLAVTRVLDETRRLLQSVDPRGRRIAETLWNQELPYVVDRVIAHCLFGAATIDPDPTPAVIVESHRIARRVLSWFARHHSRMALPDLVRCALAAGLLDLDLKGGAARCAPITTRTHHPHPAAALVEAARAPMAVDHLNSLLAVLERGTVRVVWFTDDLIETALDLLVIQHLVQHYPTMRVTVVPRRRRTDNDATYGDVLELLRHSVLRPLATTDRTSTGRVHISPHGPAHAAPRPDKLHPILLRDLDDADAVVVKGGRNHELLTGTLNRPMWTGYVVVREFTESQSGFDSRTAPPVFVHAPAGTVPWWGWRGRAHRITQVTPDLRIRWCWTTIADRERRAHLTDPEGLHAELAALVVNWPRMREHYAPQARAEIRDLADRLTRHGCRPTDHSLVTQARILTDPPGATTT